MGEHRKNLVKLFSKASYRTSTWTVFNDFCQLTALALANNSDPYHSVTPKEVWEKREKAYLATIGKYQKEEQALFPQMVAELTLELEDQVTLGEFKDVLGEAFHELELHNKWKGQFFTPQSVSDLMGRIVMDKETIRRNVDTFGYVNINEPCVGAGAMLFGFMNAFRAEGFNHSKQILAVAQDVDERCVWMAYIQLSLYGIPAIVLHQNTLSLEQYDAPWYTPVYVFDGWQWKRRHAATVHLREQEYEEFMEMLEPRKEVAAI